MPDLHKRATLDDFQCRFQCSSSIPSSQDLTDVLTRLHVSLYFPIPISNPSLSEEYKEAPLRVAGPTDSGGETHLATQ